MTTYRVDKVSESPSQLDLQIGFAGEASNDQIVMDAVAAIKELELRGGPLVRFDGPTSVPAAMALAHSVAHLYGAVAMKDPKLGKFVVVISHRPDLRIGTLLD